MTLDALYNDTPVSVNLETDNVLMGLASLEQKYPVDLNVEVAGVNLDISGWVTYPLSKNDTDLAISITGNSLGSLNDILDIELPDTSQYIISGNITTSGDNTFFKDLEFNMGDSTIKGSVQFVDSGYYKNLDIELYSHSIELTDFIKEQTNNNIRPGDINRKVTDGDEDEKAIVFEPIISALGLQNIYAKLKINVDKVLLKDQFIGDIEINGELQGGHLTIDHFEVSTPGGLIDTLIQARIIEEDIIVELVTRIENFDYSFLAKIASPDSADTGGIIDLSLDLNSYADNIRELDDHVSGYINFKVVPKSVNAKLFDIWATNLVFNFLSSLGSKSKSEMNCFVGGMKFSNGLMTPKKLYMDTTNVRVRVTGYIDLRDNRIDLLFKPIPKRKQVFNLGTPIQAVGTLDNYKITPDLFNLLWFVVRLYYVAAEIVLNIFSEDKIPQDGSDICSITIQELLLE